MASRFVELSRAAIELPAMDVEMTATATLVSPATEADDQAWSFFDVELSEYDADSNVRANVKVVGDRLTIGMRC